MSRFLRVFLMSLGLARALAAAESPAARVILVAGAVGDPEFAPAFDAQVEAWTKTCASAGARLSVVGREGDGIAPADRDRLRTLLADLEFPVIPESHSITNHFVDLIKVGETVFNKDNGDF